MNINGKNLPQPTAFFRFFFFFVVSVVGIYLFPSLSFIDHHVYRTPVRQSAKVAVVNEEVGVYLAIYVPVFNLFFGEILVYGIELNAAFLAPVYGFLQQLSASYGP